MSGYRHDCIYFEFGEHYPSHCCAQGGPEPSVAPEFNHCDPECTSFQEQSGFNYYEAGIMHGGRHGNLPSR